VFSLTKTHCTLITQQSKLEKKNQQPKTAQQLTVWKEDCNSAISPNESLFQFWSVAVVFKWPKIQQQIPGLPWYMVIANLVKKFKFTTTYYFCYEINAKKYSGTPLGILPATLCNCTHVTPVFFSGSEIWDLRPRHTTRKEKYYSCVLTWDKQQQQHLSGDEILRFYLPMHDQERKLLP